MFRWSDSATAFGAETEHKSRRISRTSGEIFFATSDSATALERSRKKDFGAGLKQIHLHSRVVPISHDRFLYSLINWAPIILR